MNVHINRTYGPYDMDLYHDYINDIIYHVMETNNPR